MDCSTNIIIVSVPSTDIDIIWATEHPWKLILHINNYFQHAYTLNTGTHMPQDESMWRKIIQHKKEQNQQHNTKVTTISSTIKCPIALIRLEVFSVIDLLMRKRMCFLPYLICLFLHFVWCTCENFSSHRKIPETCTQFLLDTLWLADKILEEMYVCECCESLTITCLTIAE